MDETNRRNDSNATGMRDEQGGDDVDSQGRLMTAKVRSVRRGFAKGLKLYQFSILEGSGMVSILEGRNESITHTKNMEGFVSLPN